MLNHEEYKQRRDEILNLHWTNGDGTSASFTSAEAAVAIDALVLDLAAYNDSACMDCCDMANLIRVVKGGE